MTRDSIVSAALDWRGTPFHHEARVKGVGVDCAQILIAVFSEVGLLPEFNPDHYPHDWHFHKSEERYLETIKACGGRQVETPKPGDVAMYRFGHCASHAAIVIEWPRCIHAYWGQGVVEVDGENSAELGGRLDSFWSLIEEETE